MPRDHERTTDGGFNPTPLFVGLTVGLLLCGGGGVWVFQGAKEVIDQALSPSVHAVFAADAFFEALSRNDVDAAYDTHTSPAFRAATPKPAFVQLVRANPTLTANHTAYPTSSRPVVSGRSPNGTTTITYTVGPGGWGEAAVGDPPKPNPDTSRTVACTVMMAEQPDGKWKVNGLTVR